MNPVPIRITLVAACFLLLLSITIDRCGKPLRTGIFKDADIGLITTWQGIEPASTKLVMNEEEIHHTDIPLGESFVLLHQQVKNLVQRNGKISIGCSLRITDTAGRVLLHEQDLFAGNPPRQPEDAQLLRCTISTGAPMQWDTQYHITILFWDKYGKGRIENKFTITTIDIP